MKFSFFIYMMTKNVLRILFGVAHTSRTHSIKKNHISLAVYNKQNKKREKK